MNCILDRLRPLTNEDVFLILINSKIYFMCFHGEKLRKQDKCFLPQNERLLFFEVSSLS